MKKESRYGPMDKNLRTGYLHYTTRSLVQILERFCESPVGADARVMLVLPEGRSPMQKEFNIREIKLIENKIIKDNEIKVENDEILSHTKGLIVNNYAQYGMPAPDDETLTANANEVLKNQDEARKIYEMLFQEKVIAFVKETAKLDEKEISYDDFVKKYS